MVVYFPRNKIPRFASLRAQALAKAATVLAEKKKILMLQEVATAKALFRENKFIEDAEGDAQEEAGGVPVLPLVKVL